MTGDAFVPLHGCFFCIGTGCCRCSRSLGLFGVLAVISLVSLRFCYDGVFGILSLLTLRCIIRI